MSYYQAQFSKVNCKLDVVFVVFFDMLSKSPEKCRILRPNFEKVNCKIDVVCVVFFDMISKSPEKCRILRPKNVVGTNHFFPES